MLYIGEMNVSTPFSVGVSDAHRMRNEGYGIGVVLYANYWKNCVVLFFFKGLAYSNQLQGWLNVWPIEKSPFLLDLEMK